MRDGQTLLILPLIHTRHNNKWEVKPRALRGLTDASRCLRLWNPLTLWNNLGWRCCFHICATNHRNAGKDLSLSILVVSVLLYPCPVFTDDTALFFSWQNTTLRISYKDHVTNEEVRAKIQRAIRPHQDLLTIVKRHKLQWCGHVSRSPGLAKTVLQSTVKRGRRQGRLKKRPSPRGQWRTEKMEKTGCEVICGAPMTPAVNSFKLNLLPGQFSPLIWPAQA